MKFSILYSHVILNDSGLGSLTFLENYYSVKSDTNVKKYFMLIRVILVKNESA